MKTNIKFIAASAVMVSMSLVGCNDLDTKPYSDHVTTEEKAAAIADMPSLASAGVVGISSTYNQYMAVYSNHIDFGWPSVMLFMDSMFDVVGLNTGYNWFSSAGSYNLGNNNNYMNNLGWYYAYKVIRSANDVLANIDADTTDPDLQLYASQGYANRGFMYFNLAQLFQYTYKGHESLPCVPIITEENADQVASEGCARSTVQEVYDQALSDINKAITFLTDCGYSVSRIAETGTKRFVSLAVAYGIRARINLVMNNWQAAADDAAKAISISGATPYSIAEASVPAFASSDDHNWMWCIFVQENDRVVTSGIINFPSHMGSLNYGYASVGAWRKVGKNLYAEIPETDCRKGWFLDEDGLSPNLSESQQAYATSAGVPAYGQVKFAPYQGVLGTSTNANDVPMMRVEEMYLIQAEATAMAGNVPDSKTILENFVKTYRNPNYSCSATTASEMQEEVWFQRRVELYGEGFSYLDLLRLNKGLDRRGMGYPTTWVYNVEAPLKPFLIPNGEMEANSAIGMNNDTWSKPNAVDDYE